MVVGNPSKDTDEWKTMDRMCEIFSTFARCGDPNNKSIGSVQWKPIVLETKNPNELHYKCLNIAKDVSYIDWPENERMQFWDQIYDQLSHMNQEIKA